ncbi:MAG: hypothetical protein OEW58_09195 [Gammaproteobacteria bacterium]|nr:hypothetical protein [Gammaproteobacteria bacterium]
MIYLFLLSIVSLVLGGFYASGIALTNEMIGNVFVVGILALFVIFTIFKFGVHYKISALNKFCLAFYYSVFEYKKKSQKSLRKITFANSFREQAEIAMSANFDPKVAKIAMKVPVSMYTKDSAYMPVLRARIKEAERLKIEAKELEGRASKIIRETENILVEKKIAEKPEKGSFFERLFSIQDGVQNMIELTVNEVSDNDYTQAPEYEIIAHIALDNNPYYGTVFKIFSMESVIAVLNRVPFMIILVGIIGTFAGFYLAMSSGGDLKGGAAVAIASSLVGLPVSLAIDYINTLFPDAERYQQAFNRYKMSLEILYNHERDRFPNRQGRRSTDYTGFLAETAFDARRDDDEDEDDEGPG